MNALVETMQKNVLYDPSDLKRKAVNRDAWRITRPARDDEKAPPPPPTIIERPQPASAREFAAALLDAEVIAADKRKNLCRRRKPRNKVSLRKRARIILERHGKQNPTKDEIRSAIAGMKTGQWDLSSSNAPAEARRSRSLQPDVGGKVGG